MEMWQTMLMLALALALGLALGAAWARSRETHALAAAEVRARVAETERDAAGQRAEQAIADHAALEDRFRVLASETLETHGERADAAAAQRMEQTTALLGPVAESLRQVNQHLTVAEKERAAQSARLSAEIDAVRRSNEQLRTDTAALVTALRQPQVRGAWGETQLRRVAEVAGMTNRCDFELQTSALTEQGMRRPDMRVHLGQARELFVDSKAPLAAFLDAAATADPAEIRRCHERFARHLKTHVDQLGGKHYWELTDGPSPEFVVLFLPGEGFLQAALDAAPDLYEYAGNRGVILATPTTLIALLRTVAHVWRQQELTENAAAVLRSGRELYDRLATSAGHLGRLGSQLNSTVAAYNKAVGSLESRVLPSARRMHALNIADADIAAPAPLQDTARPLVAPDWRTLEGLEAG